MTPKAPSGVGEVSNPGDVAGEPTGHVPPALTEPELSDQFWAALAHYAPNGMRYSSLEDITADSHLIVRGRVIGMTDGEIYPFDTSFFKDPYPVTFGIVAVDEVLKGNPVSKSPGALLVARLAQPDLSLPRDEVILFLKNYAQTRVEEGVDPAIDPDDAYYYSRPNAFQAVLRNRDSQVWIPPAPEGWWGLYGPFPSDVIGTPFEEIADEIREFVAAESEAQ